jgi:hypothetical protein
MIHLCDVMDRTVRQCRQIRVGRQNEDLLTEYESA